MENTVYYTFSTISQTLAAISALLGVFSIYRLQGLNNMVIDQAQSYLFYLNKLEREKNINTGIWFTNRELNSLITSKNYEGIRIISERERAKWGPFSSELEGFANTVSAVSILKGKVIKYTYLITLFALILIIASIIILSFSSRISEFFWLLFVPIILSISLLFFFIFRLISISLTSDL